MPKSRLIGCLAIMYLGMFPGPATSETLTWKRTVELALKNSPAMAAEKARSTVHRKAARFSEMSPHRTIINAEVGPRVSTVDGAMAIEVRAGADTTLELGDKGSKRRIVELTAQRESEAALTETRTTVSIDALVLWSRWVTASKRVTLRKRGVVLATEFEDAIKGKLAGGAATKIEYNAVRLAKVRLEVALEGAQAEYRALNAELSEVLGLTQPPRIPEKINVPKLPSLPALLKTALRNRGLVSRVVAAIKTAQARADLAQAYGIGDITLGGFLGLEGREALGGLRFSMGLPEVKRAERKAAIHRAEAEVLASERVMAERTVRRELVRAWWLWDGQRRRVLRLDRDAKPLIENAVNDTLQAVKGGRGTVLELMVYTTEAFELDLIRIAAEAQVREAAVLVLAAGGRL